MNEHICLHAIYANPEYYNPRVTKIRLKKILKSRALLSRKMQNIELPYGFNGVDYISLCDYEKRNINHTYNPNYTSFNGFIINSLSLIFPKDKLKLVNPKVIDIVKSDDIMTILGMSKEERYSDVYDEVQVKDIIPLDLMTGITLPLNLMNRIYYNENMTINMVISELKKIKKLLIRYGYNIPIYDINTFEELNDDENTKKLIKKYYQKI